MQPEREMEHDDTEAGAPALAANAASLSAAPTVLQALVDAPLKALFAKYELGELCDVVCSELGVKNISGLQKIRQEDVHNFIRNPPEHLSLKLFHKTMLENMLKELHPESQQPPAMHATAAKTRAPAGSQASQRSVLGDTAAATATAVSALPDMNAVCDTV